MNCISIYKLCASSGTTCVVLAISFLQCTITTFIRRTNGKIWEPSNKAVLFRILGSNGQKSSSPLPARITYQSVPLQCATLTLPARCADRNGLPPSRRPRAIWYRGRYGLDNLGFDFRQGEEVLMFSKNPRPAVRHTQPPAHWKPVFFFFLPGVKQPGCEVKHSHSSSTEVMNEWSCTYTPPIYLHGVYRFSIVNTRYSVRFEFLMATTVILT